MYLSYCRDSDRAGEWRILPPAAKDTKDPPGLWTPVSDVGGGAQTEFTDDWPIDVAQGQPKAGCWIWMEPPVHEPNVLEPIGHGGDSTPTDHQPSDELRRELISPSPHKIKRESRSPSCATSVGEQTLPSEILMNCDGDDGGKLGEKRTGGEQERGSDSVHQVIEDAMFDAELQNLGQWDDDKGWTGGWEA